MQSIQIFLISVNKIKIKPILYFLKKVVTGSADKTVKMIDILSGFKVFFFLFKFLLH